MTTKHTPRPWVIAPSSNPRNGTDWRDIYSNGTDYAPAYVGEALTKDADLICAAPDLLHAAEVAFEILAALADPQHVMHEAMKTAGPELLTEWRDTVAAAIAKAKGE